MSTKNEMINYGGVDNYVTSLLSNEIKSNYGIPKKSDIGGSNYRPKIPKSVNSHVIREFLPIKKASTNLDGISKVVTSFPKAVARSSATAPPTHALIYSNDSLSKDVADLNDTESSILENILKKEIGMANRS